jgi:hypothetical protein
LKSNRLIAVRIDADREHDVVAAVHIDSGFHVASVPQTSISVVANSQYGVTGADAPTVG